MKKWVPIKEKIVTLRITDAMNRELEIKARQIQKSISDTIRVAIDNFLSEK